MTHHALRGVLLDIDGTLIDSNDAHGKAWVDVLAEFGFEVAFDRVRELIGKGGDKLLPEVTGLSDDDPRAQRLSERRRKIFLERYLPHITPFRDARALVVAMKDAGLDVVVATSAGDAELEPLLAVAEVDQLLPRRASSEGKKSKPDPDIIQSALERAKLRPSEALMLGDTPYDIEAAARAGVDTIALRCGGWDDESLRHAVAIYDGPHELLARYQESPLHTRR